jgi:hypothetical protein
MVSAPPTSNNRAKTICLGSMISAVVIAGFHHPRFADDALHRTQTREDTVRNFLGANAIIAAKPSTLGIARIEPWALRNAKSYEYDLSGCTKPTHSYLFSYPVARVVGIAGK